MTVYSKSDSEAVLARLHPPQIRVLIDMLRQSTHRKQTFVESIYNERAQHFQETLRFLIEIGWVHEDRNILGLTPAAARFPVDDSDQMRAGKAVAEAIADFPNPYRTILSKYLIQFQHSGGRVFCQPSPQSRLDQSAIRNFLMELGLVSHETDSDSYFLRDYCIHLFLWAKNIHGARSKAELLSRAALKDQLGTAAELIVLEFEKKRVGADLCDQVEHVSIKNPGASFDIKSLGMEGSNLIPRFIEVKAVAADSYQFYWSARELEAASLLREKYFLYLLPALGGDIFDLPKMAIISDPYATVYQNPAAWLKEENVIVCRRRPHSENSESHPPIVRQITFQV